MHLRSRVLLLFLQDYSSADGSSLPRCNQAEFFSSSRGAGMCPRDSIVNPENLFVVKKNVALRRWKLLSLLFFYDVQLRGGKGGKDAVQVSPQRVHMKLRVKESEDLEFYYAQAQDYPVDLYYLMDLSKSMEDDKDKLSALGNLLAETMQNLTSNFKLGFGSFVDKTVMPYVSTVPRKCVNKTLWRYLINDWFRLREPCNGCVAPYGYINHMPLSEDTRLFSVINYSINQIYNRNNLSLGWGQESQCFWQFGRPRRRFWRNHAGIYGCNLA